MKVYAVVDAGYGDSGKGLMTDYFCEKLIKHGAKVLNVKSNGGAQAGHTVSRISKEDYPEYQHFVFHTLGSGTFIGADTYLASKFIFNPNELKKEIEDLGRAYCIAPTVYINPLCRLSLSADIQLNRLLEESRSKRHGTCGLGIFETVHRNHMGFGLRLLEALEETESDLESKINTLTKTYIEARTSELKEKENLIIQEDSLKKLLDSLSVLAKSDVKCLQEMFDVEDRDRPIIATLNDAINIGNYTDLVFEASQGLELDWRNPRNFPHTTASHTGLKNVYKELNKNYCVQKIDYFEACYVTRSYKTKHGDGDFVERLDSIFNTFRLYDRTNVPNQYQGTLRFGYIDPIRLAELINNDFNEFRENISFNPEKEVQIERSLAVTHLDQTNEGIITGLDEVKYFKEFTAEKILGSGKTYWSFGEKAQDIVEDY